MTQPSRRVIHETRGAGRWFPGGAGELASQVGGFIDHAQVPPVPGRVVAAVSPHAGYDYSGATSGSIFRVLKDQACAGSSPDVVVVLGFTHQLRFRGVALLDGDALRSPLGEAQLDRQAAAQLVACGASVVFDNGPHAGEHSAENQVPFLQMALPDVGLVVALMGDHEQRTRSDLASGLRALSAERNLLVVASSDMLHDPDYDRVTRTDHETLAVMERMDADRLASCWRPEHQVLCGFGPVQVAMAFARFCGCDRGVTLSYCNSGDDHPESRGSWVVGYGALVFPV